MGSVMTKRVGTSVANTPGTGVLDDLKRFGITIADIDARKLTPSDIDAMGLDTAISAYKIPYYDINGRPSTHFRLRKLPDPSVPGDRGGFIRLSRDSTRIYFPADFADTDPKSLKLSAAETVDGVPRTFTPLFVVDDERLAVHILKVHGYKSVAMQGPAGWQSAAGLAEGFQEVCEHVIENSMTIMLWIGDGTDKNIQREVANLAMAFKFHGVPFKSIRQYTDNGLVSSELRRILAPLSRFPKHPNIRQYIQDKIGDTGAKLTRKDHIELALAILSDMESRGTRIRSTTTGDYYYFEHATRELIRASLVSSKDMMEHSDFMSSIYTRYGLSPNDGQTLRWLSTQFMAEEPIRQSTSYRTLMCDPRFESTFALQVSPSEFVHIADGEKARVRMNGDKGILFERGNTRPVDVDLLKAELHKQRQHDTLPLWWMDIVREVRLNRDDRFRMMLSLLYYVSPWLKGWREIQLPIEVVTGEAGTGKSSLFALRLNIMSGEAEMKGLPDSVRGWHTEVVNTSGICLFDNVHLTNKIHMQALSDEMCRLVTEAKPTISRHQLYKTADLARFPVQCTFGLTSIENVFTKIDFLQRSIVLHLDRAYSDSAEVLFSGWVQEKLESRGGREAWLAHHIVAIERFFEVARKQWNSDYKSKIRLINFEQALMIMGSVFGLEADWLPDMLSENSKATAIRIDWVLEGLSRFTEEWRRTSKNPNFTASDVVDWAACQDDFDKNATLTNARRLGRYVATHKTVVRQTTGIVIMDNSKRGCGYAIDINPTTAQVGSKVPEAGARSRDRPRRNDRDQLSSRSRADLNRAIEDEDS